MTQDCHPCQIFIGGTCIHSVLISSEELESGKFWIPGCSHMFVIKSQSQIKDAIALDCTIVPQFQHRSKEKS